MKVIRQGRILEIINSKEIETQEELAEELRKSGIEITQATVSRDIKELKLIKISGSDGKYKYASSSPKENFLSNKLINIFSQTVVNIDRVKNIVVVRAITGAASAAAEAIDCLNLEENVGTIAGDNTIFILTRTDEKANDLYNKLKKMMNE